MNIEPLTSESINYHTCKFRSEEPVKRVIKRCSCQGGDYEITDYFCNKREIFGLNYEICKECSLYEPK